MKSNMSDDAEVSWQSGKMSAKIELNWKGETVASDRKGELDLTYEYRVSFVFFLFFFFKFVHSVKDTNFFCCIYFFRVQDLETMSTFVPLSFALPCLTSPRIL